MAKRLEFDHSFQDSGKQQWNIFGTSSHNVVGVLWYPKKGKPPHGVCIPAKDLDKLISGLQIAQGVMRYYSGRKARARKARRLEKK